MYKKNTINHYSVKMEKQSDQDLLEKNNCDLLISESDIWREYVIFQIFRTKNKAYIEVDSGLYFNGPLPKQNEQLKGKLCVLNLEDQKLADFCPITVIYQESELCSLSDKDKDGSNEKRNNDIMVLDCKTIQLTLSDENRHNEGVNCDNYIEKTRREFYSTLPSDKTPDVDCEKLEVKGIGFDFSSAILQDIKVEDKGNIQIFTGQNNNGTDNQDKIKEPLQAVNLKVLNKNKPKQQKRKYQKRKPETMNNMEIEKHKNCDGKRIPPKRVASYKVRYNKYTPRFIQDPKVYKTYVKCEKCDKVFVNQNLRLRHQKIVHDSTDIERQSRTCFHCDKDLRTIEYLRKHVQTVHGNLWKCHICDKIFKERPRLDIHISSHTKPYKCSECEQCFTHSLALDAHMQKHTGKISENSEHAFRICHICGAVISQMKSWKMHLLQHNEDKPFGCSQCSAAFTSKSSLKMHVVVKHLGEYPCLCDVCGAGFHQPSQLDTHRMMRHLPRAEWKWKCDVCEKRFAANSCLRTHQKIHTGEQPHLCPYCERRFLQRSGLKTHLRTHTGEKPYICPVCGQGFSHKVTLTSHRKTHN